MAPPVRLTIEKEYQGEFFTNVYWLNYATPTAALADAEAIYNAERTATSNQIIFTKYRIDDAVQNTDNYTTVVVNTPGSVDSSGQQLLPLFAVLRVDFTVDGSRPSRKYYRGMVFENNLDGPYNLVTSFVSARQTDLAAVIAGVAGYVDVDNQPITGGVVYPKIAMRQLRRGSKKKVIPSTDGTT